MSSAPPIPRLLALAAALTLAGCLGSGPGNTVYDFDSDGVQDQDDCDPADPSIYPGADDPYGNGIDEDCDGADGDADDLDNDGEPNESDCDRNDPSIYPGADDPYGDGIDQNCDGNDGVDSDGDGYPAAGEGVPDELEDCNDTDESVHPAADDPDDAVDQDCDGFTRSSRVDVQPEAPTTTDTLFALVTTEATVYDLSWFVDGVERPENSGFQTIQPPQTSKGESWRALVTPYNSEGETGASVEDAVIIVNSPPTVTIIQGLDPDPVEGMSLSPAAVTTDPDGDSVTVSYLWFVNGVQENVESVAELTSESFDKGDEIWAILTPHDGTDSGEGVETNHVSAVNTAPSASAAVLDPSSGTESTVFNCLGSGWSDPDPVDTEAYSYQWYVAGLASSTTASLDGASFDRGGVIYCEATPTDGEASGVTISSDSVTIGNSIPSITDVLIAPALPTETAVLTATISGWSDPDPADIAGYDYKWHVDGVTASVTVSIDGTLFDRGQDVYLIVTPDDGIAEGIPVTSNTVTIQNTPPQITSVTLGPDPATTEDVMISSVDGWFDPDPADQSPAYNYLWWVNTTSQAGSDFLSSSYFVKNDEVYVEVAPTDGEDPGPVVTSATLVIDNTPPTAPGVEISPPYPMPDDALVCAITPSFDPDVLDSVDPPLTYDFRWTSDGNAQTAWDQSGLADSGTATVDSSATSGYELWTCEVQAWDGTDLGPVGSATEMVAPDCSSVTFDGVDDYATIGGLLSLGSTATYEMWLYGAPDQDYLPSGRPLVRTNCASINWSAQGIIVEQWPNCSGTGSGYDNPWDPVGIGTYPTGWWHLAVTIDVDHTITVYVDGELEGSRTLGSSGWSGVYPGSLAASYSQGGSVGGFTAVTFSSVRVSEGLRYSAGFTPTWPLLDDVDTALLYSFGEGTGQVVGDDSGGGRDATLIGALWGQSCPSEDLDSDGWPAWQDCDDGDAANYPTNTEVCDGQDNDCDPSTSSGADDVDADGDGFPLCLDCDDSEAQTWPGAPEQCNGVDDDCDPTTSPNLGEDDLDNDGVPACYDCDDNDPSLSGATRSLQLDSTSWFKAPSLALSDSGYTIEAWYKTSTGQWADNLAGRMGNSGCGSNLCFGVNTNNLSNYGVGIDSPGASHLHSRNDPLPEAAWVHLAWVYRSGGYNTASWDFYEDGQHRSDETRQGGCGPSNFGGTGWSFGGCERPNNPGDWIADEGMLSQVRVSNFDRYSANFTPPLELSSDANTLALWKLHETTAGIVPDLSGNGHGAAILGNGVLVLDSPSPACTPPNETDCDDGVDNDGNGDIDCADSFCAGADLVCSNCPSDNDNDGVTVCGPDGVPGTIDDDCDDDDPDVSPTTAGCVGTSCLQLMSGGYSRGDGNYWIDADDDGAGVVQMYCDMSNDGGGWTRVAVLTNSTYENDFLSEFDGLDFTQFAAVYNSERIWSDPSATRTIGTWESNNCTLPGVGSSPCYAWPGFNRWDGGTGHVVAMAQQAQAEMGNFGGFFSHCGGSFGPGFGFSQQTHCAVSRQLYWNAAAINGPLALYLR